LISCGIYGYPKAEALGVATSAIRDFLDKNEMDVTLAVFDRESLAVSEKPMGAVEKYINDNYVELKNVGRRMPRDE